MLKRIKPILLPALMAGLFSACQSSSPDTAEAGAETVATLSTESYGNYLTALAADEMEGRKPFTSGEQKTLDYLEREFKALGLEPGEKHIMKSRPRRPRAPILGRLIISRMIVVAAAMALATLAIFYYFLQSYSVDYARTIAFNALVVMQWANAFNARSELQSIVTRLRVMNAKFYFGLALAVATQAFAMFGPMQDALHLVPVALTHLAVTSLMSIVVIIVTSEAHKYFSRKFRAAQARKYASPDPKPAEA
jgi:hypothetical protein